MKKRLFHAGFAVLALALAPLVASSQEVGSEVDVLSERPNILFIVVDDLSDAIEGMGAIPAAKTPGMSSLAKEGVLFSNAYANSPVCAPSRNSLLSGLYPSTTGAYNFRSWDESELLSTSVSLFEHFKSNGYITMGTGKLHHSRKGHNGDWSVINNERQFESNHDAGPWPWNGDPNDDRTIHPDMAYVLDHTDGLSNQKRMTGSSSRFLSFGRLSNIPSYPADPETGFPGYTGWQMDGKPFKYNGPNDRDLMPDERKTVFAKKALLQDYDAPFFLAVGFNRPHEPLYVPDEYIDMYPLDEIELPPFLTSDWDDLQMIPETSRGYAFDRYKMYMRAGGTKLLKEFVQSYLASTAMIDDQVQEILQTLEKSKYAENTVVVLMSDHGYNLGEKGAVYKATLWDESTRIPLIIKMPGGAVKGKVSSKPVSLIDIYPTLTDLAGISSDPHARTHGRKLDGHSLKPLLNDPDGDWGGPEYAFSTIYGSENQSSEDWEDHNFSVRGERWRYTRHTNGGEELYDTLNDPEEWRNLAIEPDYEERLKEMRNSLAVFLDYTTSDSQ